MVLQPGRFPSQQPDDEGCGADKDEERTVVSADVLSGSEIVVGPGSVTVENDMCDRLDVGLFGPDDIYFYGEVGCWKDSGRDLQMVNARQFKREGCTEMTISDNEKEEFYMEDAMLSSYPMKRIEPVINNLMQSKYSTYFQADAANGFWAVPMYPPHAYRTWLSTYKGQWQHLRMGQGLSGAPQTYTRMKDIFGGYIPVPNPEPTLNKSSSAAFECFVDDDFGAHPDFFSQFEFLHNHYFPRLMLVKLTLKGSKSRFFLDKISPLR